MPRRKRNSHNRPTMPFGKYFGFELSELPDSYLQWLSELADLREPLASALRAEWHARFGDDDGDDPVSAIFGGLDLGETALLGELIRAGYHSLAQRFHPDHAGGSAEIMKTLNSLVKKLRGQVAA